MKLLPSAALLALSCTSAPLADPSSTPADLGAAVMALAPVLPLPFPVEIRILDLSAMELEGRTTFDERLQHFVIELDDDTGTLETLAHEWAHCYVWGLPEHTVHSDFWGVAYARAYRALVDE